MVKPLACPAAEPNTMSEKRARNSSEVADFQIPTTLPKRTKVCDNAPVHIGMQRFSDNSQLCGLPGLQDKVVVLMMAHGAKPSKFAEAFGNFLMDMHSEQDAFPKTLDEFEKRYEMRFVMGSDPPIEKQKPYARGAYVKLGCTGAIVDVLDSFFWWRYEKGIGGNFPKPRVAILKGLGITLSQDSKYECEVEVENGGARVTVPFSPLAIPGPAWSKMHASVKIEVLSDNEVHVRFEGDTISFRSNFSALSVPGRYETSNGTPLPEEMNMEQKKSASYVRIINRWDVNEEEKNEFLIDMIKSSIYENTFVIIQWLGELKDSTAVADLKKSVSDLENVYAYE